MKATKRGTPRFGRSPNGRGLHLLILWGELLPLLRAAAVAGACSKRRVRSGGADVAVRVLGGLRRRAGILGSLHLPVFEAAEGRVQPAFQRDAPRLSSETTRCPGGVWSFQMKQRSLFNR